ncbi:unnamed protein product [Cyclocybe aegerita]|uniref:Uncharacterized protein n=1 Tax=Cyclocybe aegerita TaxID=1973307 RepID=A0A8S0XZH4_CYCAE|nr:unnamed protein product [Cyclocybe aegerita]
MPSGIGAGVLVIRPKQIPREFQWIETCRGSEAKPAYCGIRLVQNIKAVIPQTPKVLVNESQRLIGVIGSLTAWDVFYMYSYLDAVLDIGSPEMATWQAI